MICTACRRAPARPKTRPGPTPTLCEGCAPVHRTTTRLADKLAATEQRIAARVRQDAAAVQGLPRDYCRCATPVGKPEGPLLVCMLCAREVWGAA